MTTSLPPPPAGGAHPASRAGTAVALLLLAAVMVVAARSNAGDSSPRTGRRVELLELIRIEQARNDDLQATVEALTAEVAALEEASAADAAVAKRLQRHVDRLVAPAGMTAVAGPGVVVTLSDSTLQTAPSGDLNDLVIHEQDLQAVINALWAGGAEAMTVNGERILSTTAIRCVGNTLLLHGNVYSPPYVVEAIGAEPSLRTALDTDPVVAALRTAATQYGLGFTVGADEELQIPAYAGPSPVKVARVEPTQP